MKAERLFPAGRNLFRRAAAGTFAVAVAVSGCGRSEQVREAEIVRGLEESFALESLDRPAPAEQGSGPAPAGSYGASRGDAAGSRSSGQATAPESEQAGPNGTSSDQTPPALQRVARDVVEMMQDGQYASAVGRLDELMRAPELTPQQRRAVRDAMAQVQRRLVMDPSISQEEKRGARESLSR